MDKEVLHFEFWDYTAFIGFLLILSLVGFLAGRKERTNKEDYFLAGKKLPWYVVGFSFFASNISSEHFIGMIGASYIYGMCVSMYSWGNIFSYSFLIWLFIPFLLSTKVFTTPEYLEYRFNKSLRQLFAIITVLVNIIAFLAAVLYGGGLALSALFGIKFEFAVVILGLFAGIWAIYGGLSSVAWTDFLTVIVMIVGGLLVTILGFQMLSDHHSVLDGAKIMFERNAAKSGVYADAVAEAAKHISHNGQYDRLAVIQPASHDIVPWPSLIFMVFSISIWFNVLNQFMIQRVLGAKNRKHARMGVVLSGYLQILIPVIVVIPGMIMFAKHPEIMMMPWNEVKPVTDTTFIRLVKMLVPIGLRGLIMAGLFAAIQSTVNSVLNSTATILTLDIYKDNIKPNASSGHLVKVGIIISTVVLIISIILGEFIGRLGESLFVYIQTLYAFFAPPFSAIFILGIFWKRTNAKGAIAGVLAGLAFGIGLKLILHFVPDCPSWLHPYPNQGILNWFFSTVVTIIVSLMTDPPPAEKINDKYVFNLRKLNIMRDEGAGWYNSVWLWWGLFALIIIFLIFLF